MNRTTRKVFSYTCLDQRAPEDPAGLAGRRSSLVHQRKPHRLNSINITKQQHIQSSEQSYTGQANKFNYNSTPTEKNSFEKFIKLFYTSLRPHRREDHEKRSYNEKVRIKTSFPMKEID